MTNREAVSRLKNNFKSLNKDSRVSDRFFLRTLKSISKSLISQKLLDRTLNYDYNIYSRLKCFEFELDDVVNCNIVSFRRCKTLMKSVKPLPELIYSRIGASLKNIVSIDEETTVILLDINQYRRNSKRKYKIEGEVYAYLGEDNHLYIPDENILGLNLDFITMETDLIDELNSCSKKENCKSGWDYEFICPDKLQEPVFKDAIQIIAATYASITKDSNPNGIDKQSTE